VPSLAETCAGSATNGTTVRGTDITTIGGPNASVTDSTTNACAICVTPCLQVTRNCDSVVIGSANTVSGAVTNCGNITLTNLVISDNLYGTLATIPTLAPNTSQAYSRLVTNITCGNFENIVTASGTTACGAPITASATNTCVVTEAPCITVTMNCDTVVVGLPNTVSGVVSNCGNVTLSNIVLRDNLYGQLTNFASLAPGTSQAYSRLVTNLTGSFPNIVTASGRSLCGTPASANATNTCVVTANPCAGVSKTCDTEVTGQINLLTAVASNGGNGPIKGIVVVDNMIAGALVRARWQRLPTPVGYLFAGKT
jgi:hypothetical protein